MSVPCGLRASGPYIGALIQEMASALELASGEQPDPDRLVSERGWNDGGSLAVRWLVETLELYGLTEPTLRRMATRPRPRHHALGRAPRARPSASFPAAAPAYEVLALCAAALPAVLRGELRGQDALFGPTTLGLWFDYFSNANPHYALNNIVASRAVARAAGAGARVLEFGGGGGSAAEATLAALAEAGKAPSAYVFTELQPAFLRRGSRRSRRSSRRVRAGGRCASTSTSTRRPRASTAAPSTSCSA